MVNIVYIVRSRSNLSADILDSLQARRYVVHIGLRLASFSVH